MVSAMLLNLVLISTQPYRDLVLWCDRIQLSWLFLDKISVLGETDVNSKYNVVKYEQTQFLILM